MTCCLAYDEMNPIKNAEKAKEQYDMMYVYRFFSAQKLAQNAAAKLFPSQ